MNLKDAIDFIKSSKSDIAIGIYIDNKSFDSIITQLIATTPTGELRNSLTDLNILHMSINDSWEKLNKTI